MQDHRTIKHKSPKPTRMPGADPETLKRRGASRDSSEKGAARTIFAILVNLQKKMISFPINKGECGPSMDPPQHALSSTTP